MDELVYIDKPPNMTSFGVVARVRRVFSQAAGKKVKVGHTGTLDPFATGLMILLVGRATKRSDEFLKLDKVYEAEFILGQVSSTGDPEGELSNVSTKQPTIDEVERAVDAFRGQITQTPPIYSAIKINGQRAYKLARKGEQPDIPKRQVNIYALDILDYQYPSLKVRAHVSSGTYIRTLAQDIGEKLGVGAYCRELRRTKIADYSVEQAKTLEGLGILS